MSFCESSREKDLDCLVLEFPKRFRAKKGVGTLLARKVNDKRFYLANKYPFLASQPRKIQFLRTFGVGPFFFFFGSNQRERYFSMEHGRWKVARRSLHQLPQPPPETFDDDNPQPPKINWSP